MKKVLRSLLLAAAFAVAATVIPVVTGGGTVAYAADGFVVENGELTEYNGPGGAVTVPDYVRKIGNYAFENCTGITSVTVPSSVTSIGRSAFEGCSGLTKVTLANSVTALDDYTFQYCTSLTDLTIPSSVTSIGESAFYGCTALKSIKIPDSVRSIGDSAFSDCSGLTGVSLSNSLTKISYCMFSRCSGLKSVTIPKSVTSIERWAFDECTGLTQIVIPNSVTTIGYGSFTECKGLKTVSIPHSVTLIDEYAFEDCTGLTSVSIPASVTTIGRGAFYGCKGLTGVTIPASVTSIDSFAFEECTGLKTVTILTRRASVASDYLFDNCGAVTDVYYAGSQSEWLASGFDSCFTYPVKIHYHYSPVRITAEPVNRSIALGKSVTLSVMATGSGLKYQWYFKKSGQTAFSVWNSRTHASETVTPNATWDGIQLYCRVTDISGRSVKSTTVTVRVLSIAVQPRSQSILLGKSVTLSVKATGSALQYQWYFKKKGQSAFSVWNNRTHASETVTPNATWNGIQLYCLVRDSAGNSVKSDAATVTVTSSAAPQITQQPASVTVHSGDSAKFSVKATGTGLKYQWYYRKKGVAEWSKWGTRTTASTTATANDTWQGMQVRCVVTDSSNRSVTSSAAVITIAAELKITAQPTNKTVTAGNSVTLSLKASGTGMKYQWYFKKSGQSAFSVWNGRTHASETVSPNATWNGIQLYCIVTDGAGKSVSSNIITVTVR